MKTVVVEVSGGVVQQIYSDAEDIRLVIVDWDDCEGETEKSCAGEMRPEPLDLMSEETAQQLHALDAAC